MTTRTALISCAGRYMGPAIKEKFESLGITVVSGDYPMTTQTDCEELVSAAGQVDILIANLAEPPMTGPVQDIENADWNKLFDSLVHPLMYLIRAVTPQMLDRQAGKIIA
ncbi:MAG TPA: short-chain dehydrogenase, partial [Gammaproteobacteria bacterium]|nr:short-chain dehydrogenase [Gammaproteobacteria bacterium]